MTPDQYIARQAATLGRRPVGPERWVPTNLPEAEGACLGVLRSDFKGTNQTSSLALSKDGKYLFTGSPDDDTRCWDLTTGRVVWMVHEDRPGENNEHTDIAVSPNGEWLASAYWRKQVLLILETKTGRCRHRFELEESPWQASWSPDGLYLAVSLHSKKVIVISFDNGIIVREFGTESIARGVQWAPDGKTLACRSDNHGYFWNTRSWKTDLELNLKDGVPLSWEPSCQFVAIGNHQGKIEIRDPSSWMVQRTLIGKGGVLSIIFSTDGQLLASGHEYGLTFLWDTTTGKEITRFERPDLPDKQGEIDYATWRLAWHPSGSFLAASYNDGTFRLLDTRPYLPPQSANVTQTEPLPEYRYLPKASTVLPGKPLVLLHDLTQLTGNYRPDNTVAALKNHPIIRDLIALRWPQAARVGLAGLILHQVPFPDWVPPEGLTPTMLRDGLSVALAGEEIEPEQVTVPLAALRKAADSIDDRMLALLQLLGPEAVAKDPGLPIRLLPHVDHLPPLTAADRRLLGLRLDLRGAGRASGRGPGAERAGVSARGAPRDLLPGQLALAHDLFAYRAYTNTLLYRDRQGREPPLLRPTVLLLDVSPPVFGPVEGTTRLAAHAVAATLVEAGIPCVLVTAGGRPTVRHLKQAADLMEIWTARVYDFPDEAEALKRAEALAGQLRDGPLEPVILLLTHAHFACDLVNPPKPAQLRGLFIQYPNQEKRPALADHCRRWESLPAGNKPTNLAGILAHLVG